MTDNERYVIRKYCNRHAILYLQFVYDHFSLWDMNRQQARVVFNYTVASYKY
jgi:hypothetical protein